nr:Asp23/Gls24 family envelope stress response protein [Streptomyces sp. SID5468]
MRIADRVIAKLAAHAAREALGGAPGHEHVPHRHRRPRAWVTVHAPRRRRGGRGRATIRLAVHLGYPADLAAVGTRLGRHVAERVGALAGVDVTEVAVDVERLHSGATTAAGTGRVR